jgi:hypothetical protein
LNGLCDRRNNSQAYEVLIDSHKFPLWKQPWLLAYLKSSTNIVTP